MNTRVKAMINFAYFCSNYDPFFIELAWKNEPEKIRDMKIKFSECYASAKAVGAVLRFVHNLDEQNRNTLLDWIDKNYTAFPETEVESIEKIEEAFERRRITLNLKESGAEFNKEQAAFFAGAATAINESPPLWFFSTLRGDNIYQERQKINLKKS